MTQVSLGGKELDIWTVELATALVLDMGVSLRSLLGTLGELGRFLSLWLRYLGLHGLCQPPKLFTIVGIASLH